MQKRCKGGGNILAKSTKERLVGSGCTEARGSDTQDSPLHARPLCACLSCRAGHKASFPKCLEAVVLRVILSIRYPWQTFTSSANLLHAVAEVI